jgi:hypothetical protein
MAGAIDLEGLKGRVSKKLLEIDGVTGIGVGPNRLHIYLAHDDDRVRAAVASVMNADESEAPFEYITTGSFFKQ